MTLTTRHACWVITRDFAEDSDPSTLPRYSSHPGPLLERNPAYIPLVVYPRRFRLLLNDVVMFEGRAGDLTVNEPLDEYGAFCYSCTSIEYWREDVQQWAKPSPKS